jgi:LacI family transcriptional regulator
LDTKIPIIVLNSQLNYHNVYSILINHESGMRLAIEHLHERGRKHIAYVQDAETFSGRRKAASFAKLLDDGRANVFKSRRGIEDGAEATDRILAAKTKYDAIIYGDDLTALGGLYRLNGLGVNVPKDMSIVGWNNTVSQISSPQLTTINNQNEMTAVVCVKMIENILEGVKVTSSVSIDSSLIIRESS